LGGDHGGITAAVLRSFLASCHLASILSPGSRTSSLAFLPTPSSGSPNFSRTTAHHPGLI